MLVKTFKVDVLMEKIVSTIIPIFAVIIFGNLLRSRGFLPEEFTPPANDLVYHVAIPVMIFEKVAESNFRKSISLDAVISLIGPVIITFALVFLVSSIARLNNQSRGTLVQSSIHGNLGYVAFAVAYYFLGGTGFTKTVIIGSFLILTQNFISVSVLEYFLGKGDGTRKTDLLAVIRQISINPIILATLLGIVVSLTRFPIPIFVERTLKIISNMALPMALFLIGASISVKNIKKHLKGTLTATFFKLIILPATGYVFLRALKVPGDYRLPCLILLAAPSATVTYIMAVELHGDPELAATNISVSTLMSGLMYIFWLSVGSGTFSI